MLPFMGLQRVRQDERLNWTELHQNVLNSNIHINVSLCPDCHEVVIGLDYQKSEHILTNSSPQKYLRFEG